MRDIVIIGIDPGKTGGIAYNFPSYNGPRRGKGCVEAHVMPHLTDFSEEMFDLKDSGIHVFIEKAQTMPRQGIVSAFNYGQHFGELLGILVAFSIPHTLVPPTTWTKVMHAGCKKGKAKDRSREAVMRLFPDLDLRASNRSKNVHEGMMDAVLISEYGRRSL